MDAQTKAQMQETLVVIGIVVVGAVCLGLYEAYANPVISWWPAW